MLQGDPLSTQRLAAHLYSLSNTVPTLEIEGPIGTTGSEHRPRETTHRVKGSSSRFQHGSQTTTFYAHGHQRSDATGARRSDYHRLNTNSSNHSGFQHSGMMTMGHHDYQGSFPGRPEQFQNQSYLAPQGSANNLNVRKHSAGAGVSMPVSDHQDAPGAMVAHVDYYGQSFLTSAMSEPWRHCRSGEPFHSNGPQINRSSSLDSTTGYKSNHHNRAGNPRIDSTYHSRRPLCSQRSKSHHSPASYSPVAPAVQEYAVSWGHPIHRVMPPPVYYSTQSYPTYLQPYESHGSIAAIYDNSGPYRPPMSSHSPTLTAADSSASRNMGLPTTTSDTGSFGGQGNAF